MSVRELVVLGTASQAPSRRRNHNGYLLRWDGQGVLFDPGEGTQRQLLLAGVPSSVITRICLTRRRTACGFEHCILPRRSLPGPTRDRATAVAGSRGAHRHGPLPGVGSAVFFHRLRHASSLNEVADLREEPVERDGSLADLPIGVLHARRLDHPVESFGYRLVEPDGRRLVPELLTRFGLAGP